MGRIFYITGKKKRYVCRENFHEHYFGKGRKKVLYKNGRVYISKTQYYNNVPQAKWGQFTSAEPFC